MYQILYQFRFDRRDIKTFKFSINPENMVMLSPEPVNRPVWTKLEYHQCACCTLDNKEQPYCPIASNIANIIETFKDKISYERCEVRCITPERTYLKKTSHMEGLSSVFGLVMAVSGCPVMFLFKPMARFHLPFATVEETIIRTTAFYLLRQYFAFKQHYSPDLKLSNLNRHYETIKVLNAGLLSRTKNAGSKDSDKNAILTLHAFSELISMEINTSLQGIEYLFKGNSTGELMGFNEHPG